MLVGGLADVGWWAGWSVAARVANNIVVGCHQHLLRPLGGQMHRICRSGCWISLSRPGRRFHSKHRGFVLEGLVSSNYWSISHSRVVSMPTVNAYLLILKLTARMIVNSELPTMDNNGVSHDS